MFPPVDQRKRQKVEDRGGVQSTVQHDGCGLEFEDIARQRWVTRQTVLKRGTVLTFSTHYINKSK